MGLRALFGPLWSGTLEFAGKLGPLGPFQAVAARRLEAFGMAQDLHVVFGAGQIGSPLARLLREHGHAVRMVRRSGSVPYLI